MRAQEKTSVVGAVAVVGLLLVAHAVGVASSLDNPDRLRIVHDLAGWGGSLLGLLGTVAAARAFAPADYQRKVWGSFAAGAALLLVGTALRSHWTHLQPDRPFTESPLLAPRMVVVVAANLASTYALVLLVRTYRRSGLELPSSPRVNVLWALGGLAALGIAIPQVLADVRRLDGGTAEVLSSVTSFASTVSDFASILLVVPILRVAYMMRGGRLAWAWWAFGLSGAVWLIYDVRGWLAAVLPGSPENTLELLRVTRSLGLSLLGLAGWMQRAALDTAPRQAEVAAPAVHHPAA